jgi:tetratricopeptide (TPR) repeat protein
LRPPAGSARGAALLLVGILIAGCAPSSVEPEPPVRVGPPLPPEALLTLESLSPTIRTPSNSTWPQLSPIAQERLTEGEAGLEKRDFVSAVERLERAASIAPDHPRIHRALGIAYARMRNEGKALASLRIAASGAPDDLEVQALVGRLELARGAREEATIAFRTALMCSGATDESPWAAEALWSLSELLTESGYHTAALECQARLQAGLDRFSREYTSNRTVRPIALNPERLMARRGDSLLRLGRPEEASRVLEQAYRLDRTRSGTAILWMKALMASGSHERAIGIFGELAAEPALSAAVPELARSICEEIGEPGLPRRLWDARKASERVDGALAVALAESARRLGAEDDTRAILDSVLETMPGNAVVGRFLARLHAKQGRPAEAMRVLGRVLSADETALGQVVEGVADLAPMIVEEDFERRFAATVTSEDVSVRHALYYVAAELSRLRGKTHLAAELLTRSVEIEGGFLPAYEALADVYLSQGRQDQVERLVARLRQADPEGSLADFIHGKLELIAGRSRRAAESLERAQSQGPRVPAMLLLGEAYSQLRQLDKAAEVLKEAARLAPDDPGISARLFDLYVRTRSIPAAEAILVRLPSESFDARRMRAEIALIRNQTMTAEKLLEELRGERPDDPTVLRLSIQSRLAAGPKPMPPEKRDEAVGQLRELLRHHSSDAKATRLLVALLGVGEEALEVLEQGHRARPGDVEIALTYASALEKARRYTDAADILQSVLENTPDDPRLQLALGETLLRAERLDEAAQQGRKGLEQAIRPRTAMGFRFLLLRIYSQAEDYDSAQTLLDDWILATGDDRLRIDLQARKIQLFADAGDMDRGEDAALEWIRRSPRLMAPRETLVGALARVGRFERAMELLDQWAQEVGAPKPPEPTTQTTQATKPPAPPRNAEMLKWCRRMQAHLLMVQGEYAAALARIDVLLETHGADLECLTLKGACLNELGRPEEGLAALEAAQQLEPDEAGVNNDLGYSYADRGVKLDKAERLVRRALAEQPDNVAFMDSLGWVFYKQGRFAEAARKFDQILQRDDLDEEGHPVIFDHAGDVYYRLGRMDEARTMWQRALRDATEEERVTSELRAILERTPRKLEALQEGRTAPVAPVVETSSQPASQATSQPSGQPG